MNDWEKQMVIKMVWLGVESFKIGESNKWAFLTLCSILRDKHFILSNTQKNCWIANNSQVTQASNALIGNKILCFRCD